MILVPIWGNLNNWTLDLTRVEDQASDIKRESCLHNLQTVFGLLIFHWLDFSCYYRKLFVIVWQYYVPEASLRTEPDPAAETSFYIYSINWSALYDEKVD